LARRAASRVPRAPRLPAGSLRRPSLAWPDRGRPHHSEETLPSFGDETQGRASLDRGWLNARFPVRRTFYPWWSPE
jgi:hypothetical protein